jgi:hypothetical protein
LNIKQNRQRFHPRRLALIAAAGLSMSACEAHDHDEAPGLDACEHFESGPALGVSAGTTADAAVDASAEHTRYDITVAGAERRGYLTVAIGEAADYVVFFDAPVALTVTDRMGGEVEPEAVSDADDACAVVANAYTFALGVGTHVFEVVPTVDEPFAMVIVPASHSH